MAEATAKTADQGQRVVKVGRAELPLCCPRPVDEVWNMHPRVYLSIEKSGEAVCPYCGARYVLEE
jgi:uncharacterized Zn-finger protein